jgi:hypothetical protein
MLITRLYTGTDGESHFQYIDLPFKDTRHAERRTDPLSATSITYREASGAFDLDWHPAPRRQFIINLKGQAEIKIGDGTKRVFGPGDVMLAEDTTGHGHITRVIGKEPRISIVVTLD